MAGYGAYGEHRIVIGVQSWIFELPVYIHTVALSPLDEFRFEVDIGLGNLFQVDIAGENTLGDESATLFESAVEINGPYKSLESVSVNVIVVRGDLDIGSDQLVETYL